MRLDELRTLIIESDREHDWHEIEAGPYFTDAPDVDEDTFHQHNSLLVFRPDLDLTIQWGMDAQGPLGRLSVVTDIWESAVFPDASVSVFFVDIFWRGSLVDREQIVGVDGYRAYLPLGTRRALNYNPSAGLTGQKPVWEYSATAWQRALASLIDTGRQFDRYFQQTGMIVKD